MPGIGAGLGMALGALLFVATFWLSVGFVILIVLSLARPRPSGVQLRASNLLGPLYAWQAWVMLVAGVVAGCATELSWICNVHGPHTWRDALHDLGCVFFWGSVGFAPACAVTWIGTCLAAIGMQREHGA